MKIDFKEGDWVALALIFLLLLVTGLQFYWELIR